MQRGERARFVAVVGLLLTLLSAGFAIAGDALDSSDEPTSAVCEPLDEGDEPVEGDDPVEGDTEECDEPVGGDETVEDDEADEEEGDDAVQVGEDPVLAKDYVAEDCTGAAGLEAGDEPTEAPVPGEKHGLENAIAHLLWNCLDHPNHGLVNALTKHTLKLDAWLERRELKEERKAEREAAKAERKAERDAAKAERKAEHEAAKAARELSRSS